MSATTVGPRSTGRARAGRLVLAALAFGATLLAATPARATCSRIDLSCVAGAATETVGAAVDASTDAVDGVVDGATQTTDPATSTVVGVVQQGVSTVEETAGSVVGVAEEAVEDAVGTVPEGPRPGSGPRPDPVAETPEDRPEGDPRPGSPSEQGALAGAPELAGEAASPHVPGGSPDPGPGSREAVTSSSAAALSSPTTTVDGVTQPGGASTGRERSAPEVVSTEPPALRTLAPTGLAEAARALAFPGVLAALVLLFLASQHRLDRRAPKLALAPVEPDLIGFRRAAGR